MKTSILALDLATRAGWAWASPVAYRGWPLASLPPDQRVGPVDEIAFGMKDFKGQMGGQYFAALADWIADLITDWQPGVIVFEAPILKRGRNVIRKSCGSAAVCELIAWRRNLRAMSVEPAQWKKDFTGHGHAKKAAVMAECVRRGWQVNDDNEADALGLLDYAINYMRETVEWAA